MVETISIIVAKGSGAIFGGWLGEKFAITQNKTKLVKWIRVGTITVLWYILAKEVAFMLPVLNLFL